MLNAHQESGLVVFFTRRIVDDRRDLAERLVGGGVPSAVHSAAEGYIESKTFPYIRGYGFPYLINWP